MNITVAKEDYLSICGTIVALNNYLDTLNTSLPEGIDEERVLWIAIGFYPMMNKLFAYQPPDEKFTFTVVKKLEKYFDMKASATPANQNSSKVFMKYLDDSPFVKNTILEPALTDLDKMFEESKKVTAVLEAKKKLLDGFKKPYIAGKINNEEIERGEVIIDDLSTLLLSINAQADNSIQARGIKNALFRGNYFYLYDFDALVELFMKDDTYEYLTGRSIEKVVDALEMIFPYLKSEEKKKVYALSLSTLENYKKRINDFKSYNITNNSLPCISEIFKITEAHELKLQLATFEEAILKSKGTPFYIDYKIELAKPSLFYGFDRIIDAAVEMLQEKLKETEGINKLEVWKDDNFRLIWLLSVIWFRFKYHEVKKVY